MENAVEALKIAFAVLLFVMALTLSISSFSQARTAVDAIITMRDRDAQYAYLEEAERNNAGYFQNIYVQPSENLSRTVGIETVVSSMYRMKDQSIEIYFYEKTGEDTEEPLNIYNNPQNGPTNHISLGDEGIGLNSLDAKTDFVNALLGGDTVYNWDNGDNLKDTYDEYLIYKNGLYDEFKDAQFEEKLGEYDINSGASKITVRVITYIMQ